MSSSKNAFVFHDPLFGPISFTKEESEFLETKELARLRHIKQLSPVQIFFPTAVHTRFEHSVGVAALVKFYLNAKPEMAEASPEERFTLSAAALLHDVGHCAWSHVGEEFVRLRGVTIDPEQLTLELLKGEKKYSKYFEDYGHVSAYELLEKTGNIERVSNLIKGLPPISKYITEQEKENLVRNKLWMGQMIHGPCDFDRMDYLMRDSFFMSGIKGLIDPFKIISNIDIARTTEGYKVLALRDVHFAESLVLMREMLYPYYYSSSSLVLSEVLQRSFNRIYPLDFDVFDFWFSSDEQVLHYLRESSRDDRFLKRVLKLLTAQKNYDVNEFSFSNFSVEMRERLYDLYHNKEKIVRVESQVIDICRKKGLALRENDVVIGIALRRAPITTHIPVLTNGKMVSIIEASPLINLMSSATFLLGRSRLVVGIWGISETQKETVFGVIFKVIMES